MEDLFEKGNERADPSRPCAPRPVDDPLADVLRQIEALRREVASAQVPPTTSEAEGVQQGGGVDEAQREMAPERVARKIERLRACRARPKRDPSIAPLVSKMRDAANRTHRRLGELIDLWEEFVPAELARHTTLTTFRGGVLHVTVDSSPVAYELDRLLREGLTATLRARFRGTLARVKLRIGGAS